MNVNIVSCSGLPNSIFTAFINKATVSIARGGGGDFLIRVGTDEWARALGILGVNFSPGIRFWEVNFARALGFWQFLTKKCVIFEKRVTKVTYLLKISNCGTLRFMKTCLVIRFWGTFLPGH